jgi:biopolymer transport protein ExbB
VLLLLAACLATPPLAGPAGAQTPASSPGSTAPDASAPGTPLVAPPLTAALVAERQPGVVGAVHLPRDLSPWSMFASADIVVKAVMLGLAFASLVTWTVWLAKSVQLVFARRRVRVALTAISEERSLAGATARVSSGRGIVTSFMAAAAQELLLSLRRHAT